MSREPIAPHIVEAAEIRTRRAAALTAFKAWVTAPNSWAVGVVCGALGLLIARVSGVGSLAIWAASDFISGALLIATINAVAIYRAPVTKRYRLCYTRTAAAEATLVLRVDKRKTAQPGDVQAAVAGAWPKHQGAGRLLGEWVRDLVHSEGGRLVVTATPLLAPAYRRGGLVDDGRTAKFLIRLASKPRQVRTVPDR